jgi:hypothetical protein
MNFSGIRLAVAECHPTPFSSSQMQKRQVDGETSAMRVDAENIELTRH